MRADDLGKVYWSTGRSNKKRVELFCEIDVVNSFRGGDNSLVSFFI